MKPVKRAGGFGLIEVAFAVAFTAVATLCVTGQAFAQTGGKYCEIALTGCPQDYNGKELVVPLDAIALSAQISACGISDSLTSGGAAHAPAIVFIIDESYSMGGFAGGEWWGTAPSDKNNHDVHDPYGNRYKVTRALIDSVYAAYPSAEVGIVVFNDALVFDSHRDYNLREFGGTTYHSYINQSYMPLRPLNTMSAAAGFDPFYPNDTTWAGLLTNMFEDVTISSTANCGDTWWDGTPRCPTRGNYTRIKGSVQGGGQTDISLAFEAALEALKATSRTPENQYIIFLSDGLQDVPQGSAYNPNDRYELKDDFVTKVQNTPTTYTVFLSRNPRTTPRPQDLYDMTENIKNNGYSTSNPNSDIWVLESDFDALLSHMMEEIIKPMLFKSESVPRRIVVSSGGISDSTDAVGDNFTFIRQLPIDTADITTVEMGIRYDVWQDTIIKRPDGSDSLISNLITIDSLFMYSFTVQRSDDIPSNWMESQGLSQKCGEKPTLRLLEKGTNIEVFQVNNSMTELTVELISGSGGLFNYDNQNIRVQAMNSESSFLDVVSVDLRKINDSTYSGDFVRALADEPGIPGDIVLQHTERDSIIVFFRNPFIPLDTLRISVPFISTYMALYDGPGDPYVCDPCPKKLGDTIEVTAGDTTHIFAKFFDPNGNYEPTFESEPLYIKWKVDEPGNARVEDVGLNGKFYSETAGRTYSVTANYENPSVPQPIGDRIAIRVNPAPPHYIDIVSDTSNLAPRADPATSRVYSFDKDDRQAVFYAFERDRFGNLIRPAEGSEWSSSDPVLSVSPINDASSANIARQGNAGGDIMVNVTKQDHETGAIIEGRIRITFVGESSLASGPNPFIPGVSSVYDMLDNTPGLDQSIREDYINIVQKSGGNETGILIAATAPKSIKTRPGTADTPMAMVIIYDAVGNIVYRSKPNDLAMSNSTFGFVWDGKNNAGRTVGVGTYLVMITATQNDNRKFSGKKRIGVTMANMR